MDWDQIVRWFSELSIFLFTQDIVETDVGIAMLGFEKQANVEPLLCVSSKDSHFESAATNQISNKSLSLNVKTFSYHVAQF